MPTITPKMPRPMRAILWRLKRRQASCHWLSDSRATSTSATAMAPLASTAGATGWRVSLGAVSAMASGPQS